MKKIVLSLLLFMPLFASAECSLARKFEGKWRTSYWGYVLTLGEHIDMQVIRNPSGSYNITIETKGSQMSFVDLTFDQNVVEQYLDVVANGTLLSLPVRSSCDEGTISFGATLPTGKGLGFAVVFGDMKNKIHFSVMNLVGNKIVSDSGTTLLKR